MSAPIEVLKLGGSVLTATRSLPGVAETLVRLAVGRRVLVVVSALRGATDRLLAMAERLCPDGAPEARASLLASGEIRSAAALTLAVHAAGHPVCLLDPHRVGPWTSGPPLDAEPVGAATGAIEEALERIPLAILSGFVGRDPGGGTTVLGRGGSDLTALFLAHALGARCCLIKDAGGVFDGDPAVGPARRYADLTWEDAARVAGPCVQPKALRFARARRQSFFVGSLQQPAATRIGPLPSRRVSLAGDTAGRIGA